MAVRTHTRASDFKKPLYFAKHLDEAIDFLRSIINVKARARGRFDTQFMHQRLIAVVTTAQSDTALVRHRDHVMRVHILEQETDQPGPADVWTEQANPAV